MDDFFSVDLFNENISSLKETSKDKQKESISYMKLHLTITMKKI